MDEDQLILAVRAALERDASDFPDAERERLVATVSRDFDLSQVDPVTRWALAVALESEAGKKLPDTRIANSRTLGDLIDAIFE